MISFLLKRRALVALLVLVASSFLLARALGLRADQGVASLLPDGGRDPASLHLLRERFPSEDLIVVAVSSDRLFTREGLAVLEGLTRRAAEIEGVARVFSPVTARDLDGDELGPFETAPYELVREGRMTPEEMGRRLAAHPLFGGLLVSSDARAAAVLIEPAAGRGAPERARLVEEARALAGSVPPGCAAHVAGLPVETVEVAASAERDQRIFAPLVLGALAAVLSLLYRHPIGVLVPMAVVVLSLVWTLGLYGLAGRTLNPVAALMTPVVLVVSVEGVIHFLGRYLGARRGGAALDEALHHAFVRARAPCFNAALTTAIGLASLGLLPVPAIRDFGLFSAAGTMIAYALTMIVTPLLLSWLPEVGPRAAAALAPGRIESALRRTASAVRGRPLLAAAAAAAVLSLAAAGVARIRVETDLIGALRSRSPLYQATRFIDARLTGVNALEVLLPGAAPEDPDYMERVARLERRVGGMEGVRKVTGLPDLYARANRALHEGEDLHARLPRGEGAAEDLRDIRALLEEKAPADVARFVSADGSILRLSARVAALGTTASQALFEEIRAAAREEGLPEAVLTGEFALLSNMSTSLVGDLIRGLVPAAGLILAAMAVQFRSVLLGLVGVIPSGAAVLLVYGVMGWAGIALSVPTAMIAAVAVGMTVNGTIHLLAGFRQELRRADDEVRALDATLETSGRAIVFSAVALALGFWVGVLSSFTPSAHFAVLTGASLLLGLVCEAALLPLLLAGTRRTGRRPAPGRAAGLVLLAALAPAAAGAVAGEPLLEDQFGRADGLSLHEGETVLLLHARAPALRRMKGWEVAVLERSSAAPVVLRAVDARAVRGKKTPAEVSQRLRRDVPAEVAILVDWEGALAARFGLPESEVSVTVIDGKGRACGTESGPVREEALARVVALLSAAAREGRCP